MSKKKKSKNIPLPILILIYAVLLFAMYLSLSTLALAIWGDSVMGTVDSYVTAVGTIRPHRKIAPGPFPRAIGLW